jgi:molybdate transport system substrate-binding protein
MRAFALRIPLLVLAALAALLVAAPAQAAEIQAQVSIALRGAVADLAAAFEKRTGHTVKITVAAPGAIVTAIEGGTPADVIVLTHAGLSALEEKHLVGGPRTMLATTGFGIATRDRDPVPDISTPDGLKAALLGAKKVIYNDPKTTPSGQLFLRIVERLGIAEQVKGKAQVVTAGANVTTLAQESGPGPVLALSVLVEISGHPGAKLVGPLPQSLGVPLPYSAVLGAHPKDPAAAQAFLQALATQEAKQAYVKAGFAVEK